MARWARDLQEVLETLRVVSAILIGWSFGGLAVLGYSDLFRDDRVAAVVIVDEGPTEVNRHGWQWGFGTDAENAAFQSALLDDFPATAANFVDAMFNRRVEPRDREKMVSRMLQTPAQAAYEITRDGQNQDYRDVLERICVPTLLVAGRYGMFPPEAHQYMANMIPDAELAIFENSGHAPFIEEPDAFNRILRAFAARISRVA